MSAQKISKVRCYYAPCGGAVRFGRGNIKHLGRCERCRVVVTREGRRWRVLTEAEWADVGRAATVEALTRQAMRDRFYERARRAR